MRVQPDRPAADGYLPVPVEIARSIAEQFEKSQVVILSFDPKRRLTHTTTYGVNAFDKENAAAAGEICARAVGCDLSQKQSYEDFHDSYEPALYREALELFKKIRARQGCTPAALQSIERILKAAGCGLRQG
jgi:hypothetical protein